MKSLAPCLALGLLVGLGCDAGVGDAGRSTSTGAPGGEANPPSRSPASRDSGAERADSTPARAVPRKIIYTAAVDLVVEDFPRAEAELARLVRQFDGYLSRMEVAGSPG